MGRKRLPTVVKIRKGTAQNCRLNENEPEPKADNIVPPSFLSDLAIKYWHKHIADLTDSGVVTNLDTVALGMLCQSEAQYERATEMVNELDLMVKSKEGQPVRSPFLMIQAKCFDQIIKMSSEFGMTPASRSKVSAVKAKKKSAFDD